MKKLNRKGFTLIELLAVIVILAIIMVVTIPAILTSIGNNRQKMFETSADTVAKWFEDQYGLAQLGDPGVSTVFTGFCGDTGSGCYTRKTLTADVLNAAGVKSSNYVLANSNVTLNSDTSRACVTLKANTSGGDFRAITDDEDSSSGC